MSSLTSTGSNPEAAKSGLVIREVWDLSSKPLALFFLISLFKYRLGSYSDEYPKDENSKSPLYYLNLKQQ